MAKCNLTFFIQITVFLFFVSKRADCLPSSSVAKWRFFFFSSFFPPKKQCLSEFLFRRSGRESNKSYSSIPTTWASADGKKLKEKKKDNLYYTYLYRVKIQKIRGGGVVALYVVVVFGYSYFLPHMFSAHRGRDSFRRQTTVKAGHGGPPPPDGCTFFSNDLFFFFSIVLRR